AVPGGGEGDGPADRERGDAGRDDERARALRRACGCPHATRTAERGEDKDEEELRKEQNGGSHVWPHWKRSDATHMRAGQVVARQSGCRDAGRRRLMFHEKITT